MVKTKMLYIIGSIIIGFISIIAIFFALSAGGVISTEEARLVIASASAEKEYDGTALICDEWSIVDGALKKGHVANVKVTGVANEVGEFENHISVTISDHVGANVTGDYKIELQAGTLTVRKRVVSIRSASAEKVYDGTPLSANEIRILDNRLLKGHTASHKIREEVVKAGTYDNTFVTTIRDENQVDVTHNYQIVYDYGVLEVKGRKILLSTGSAEKPYDGTPLTNREYEILDDSLLMEGHNMSIEVTGVANSAGKFENVAVVVIKDGEKDVTENYDIRIEYGTLSILPRTLTITSESATKIYDGKPLTCDTYSYTGKLFDGHKIKMEALASQTDVGEKENTITVAVYSGEVDVTLNYEIEKLFGTLTVLPREITVRSASAEKEYDGTPLRCPDYEVVSVLNVVDGHTLAVSVSGEQLSVGASENSFGQILVLTKDESGADVDVTRNYSIKTQCGKLTVKDSNNQGGGHGANAEPNGGLGGGENEDESAVLLKVLADIDATLYLRDFAFGTYNGKGWDEAKAYSKLLDDTYCYNYLFSYLLDKAGETTHSLEIESYYSYVLPYYTQMGEASYLIQTDDVLYEGDISSAYSLYFYNYDYATKGKEGLYGVNLGRYAELEREYEMFVRQQYLAVPTSTLSFFEDLISEQGFNAKDSDIIAKVAKYIQRSADYNLKYDKGLDSEEDIAVSFLRDYKEGVCRHYATSATLLYRALGIPARYVTGFMADAMANEWTEIPAKQYHAWVEVYVSGCGWVQVEVTGGSGGSGGSGNGSGDGGGASGADLDGGLGGQITPEGDEQSKKTPVFRFTSETDGSAYFRMISHGDYALNRWEEANVYTAKGLTVNPQHFPALALAEADYKPFKITVEDIQGQTPWMSSYFAENSGNDGLNDVIIDKGDWDRYTLSIYSCEYGLVNGITLVGTKYEQMELDYRRFVYENYLALPDSTYSAMESVIEKAGFDRSSNNLIYEVANYIRGYLPYDLFCPEYEGDYAVYFFEEATSALCRYYATAATAVYRTLGIPARYVVGYVGDGVAGEESVVTADKAHAWVEVYMDGFGWLPLEVTGGDGGGSGGMDIGGGEKGENAKQMKVYPETVAVKYDGENVASAPETIKWNSYFDEKIQANYTYDVEITGEQKTLGKGESVITVFKVYNAENTLVYDYLDGVELVNTEKWDIRIDNGTLQLYLNKLSFTSGSYSKVYDGTVLQSDEQYEWTGKLERGHSLKSVEFTQRRVNVGQTANMFTVNIVDEKGENISDWYLIEKNTGTLTVQYREITITADSKTFAYTDGSETFTCDTYTIASEQNPAQPLTEGDTIQLKMTKKSSIKKRGFMANEIDIESIVIVDASNKNVTDNYVIKTKSGMLILK